MRKTIPAILAAALLGALFVTSVQAQEVKKEETGKDIAFNRNKGNCLACHAMPTLPDAEQPGNSGPPLIAMKDRFPDRKVLRAKIWDPTATNPYSFMPPMGKHQILTETELEKVVDFVHGL